jgi:hypothetical protein
MKESEGNGKVSMALLERSVAMKAVTRVALGAVLVLVLGGAASADTHTWTGSDATDNNWSTPGNWDINQVPAAGDDVVVTLDDNGLGSIVVVDADTAALKSFTISKSNTGTQQNVDGPGKLIVDGTLTGSSSGIPEWGRYSRINAQVSGTGKVVLAKGGLALNNASNDYTGGTDVVDPGWRQFMYNDGSLGSGDVLISATGTATNDKNFISNDHAYSNLPKVTIRDAGATFNNHRDLTGGGPIELDGGNFGGASDPGQSWTCAVDIHVLSDSTLYGAGRTSWYDVYYTGDIIGTSTLTYRPPAQNPENQQAWMQHANLSFQGDWILGEGIMTADAVNCLGDGDLIVEGQNSRARLELDVTGATSPDSILYLVTANIAELQLDADNTVFACNVGGSLAGGVVTGGSWLPAGDYDSTTADPPGVVLSDYFNFGNSTLTILYDSPAGEPPIAEPTGLGLLGLALLGLRKKRS